MSNVEEHLSKMSQRTNYWLLQGVLGSRTTATAKAEKPLALLQVGKQGMWFGYQ